MEQPEEEAHSGVPLPAPAIKAICAFLPLPARCQARLVCRSWRGLAGEAVRSIGLTAGQLRKQVFRDFTAQQALQQLRKAAAAEAAAAGGSAAAAAAAAAAVKLDDHLPGSSSSSKPAAAAADGAGDEIAPAGAADGAGNGGAGLRQRRQQRGGSSSSRAAAAVRRQQQQQQQQGRMYRQADLNAAALRGLSRRLAAAFPAASTAVVHLEVGEYGELAPPAPDVAAAKLLLLLSCCRQLVQLRLSITAVSPDSEQVHGEDHHHHQHHHELQPQEEEVQQQQQQQQQQQPAAAAAQLGPGGVVPDGGPGGPGLNMNMADAEEEGDGFLGFDPADADYCFGWIARLLQELEQQQQQGGSSSSSSSSSVLPAVRAKRQGLQPVLLWQDSDFQQQQQQRRRQRQSPVHPWSESLSAGAGSSNSGRQQQQEHCVPLVLEVCVMGAAYPSSARDWLQLQGVRSVGTLLLPHHRPPLLPIMLRDGLAGLSQLRALQLSVDGGFNAAHAAFHWGVGVGQQGAGDSSCMTALGQLTRLTHLALHANGADATHLTAAVLQLTGLRELLLSGSTPLLLPQLLLTRAQTARSQQQQQNGLQLLVLQQQLGLWELQTLLGRFKGLKYLEVLGFWEAAGAGQSLGPIQALLQEPAAVGTLKMAAVGASTLLGPAADLLSRGASGWLAQEGLGFNPQQQQQQQRGLTWVAAAFFADAGGEVGKAAAVAAALLEAAPSLAVPRRRAGFGFYNRLPREHSPGMLLDRGRVLPLEHVLPLLAEQQLLLLQQQQQQQRQHQRLQQRVQELQLLLRWWPWLMAGQEELQQAVWQLTGQRLLMRPDELPPLVLATSSEPTAAVSCLSLLQLLLPSVRAAAAAMGHQQEGGMLPVVFDDRMPAGAMEDLLDYVFCAGPFDVPAEPTEEQQADDLAAEQTALSALRAGAGFRQQQGCGPGSPGTAELQSPAAASPVSGSPAAAAGEDAAAADPAAAADADRPAWQLLPDHSLEDTSLQLQHWLLQRYSSSNGSSSSSLKRLVTCVSSGSDLSLLAPLLPGLRSLGLSVPPCLEGFKASEDGGPVDVRTLPEVQLWMGDSGLGFGARLRAQPCSSSSNADADLAAAPAESFKAKQAEAEMSAAAAAAAAASKEVAQQQQQQWLQRVGQHPCSFAGSFLQGPAAGSQARCFAELGVLSVSNLSRADGPWEPSAVLGDQLLAAVVLGCPALKTLELSGVLRMTPVGLLLLRRLPQLSKLRLEQWTNTASDVAEQQLPVAVACLPHGLTSLSLINVDPVVSVDRLAALAEALRGAGGARGVAAAAAAAAAAEAAAAAADSRDLGNSSSSSSSSSSSVLDPVAAAASAWMVLAADAARGSGAGGSTLAEAAAGGSSQSELEREVDQEGGEGLLPPFLGYGVGVRSSGSVSRDAAAAAAAAAAVDDHSSDASAPTAAPAAAAAGGAAAESTAVIGSRRWLPPQGIALLLLDTFFYCSSSSSSDVLQRLLGCCSGGCCLHSSSCSSSGRCSHTHDEPSAAAAAAGAEASSSSISAAGQCSSCCAAGVFKNLEELSIVAHGAGFKRHSGGLAVFLSAGLPHATALQRLHVSSAGSFAAMPPHEALVYGMASALNAATFHAFDRPIIEALGSVLSSGWFDRILGALDLNLPPTKPRGSDVTAGSGSDGGGRGWWRRLLGGRSSSGGGSGGGSGVGGAYGSAYGYTWLRMLGGLPALQDLHLDAPLVLPGQLEALVSSVAVNSSLRSLSLHGVTLNLYASHQLLLDTLAGLKPLSPEPQALPAATRQHAQSAGSSSAHSSGGGGSSSGGGPSLLQHIDLSFTKHCAVAPAGLSLSKIWARIKRQQHDAATQQQLASLQQMREQLEQHRAAAVAAVAAGGPPLNQAAAATAVAAALAMVFDGDAAEAAALQQQFEAALQPQPQQQQQQQQGAAAAVQQLQQQQGPGEGEEGEAAAGAAAAAAAAAAMLAGLAGPGQDDGMALLSNMLMQLDHQIHIIMHHSPHAARQVSMGHASAASAADKQLIGLLRDALRARGVGELSVRMHGSSLADKPGQHGFGPSGGRMWGGAGSGGGSSASPHDGSDDSEDGGSDNGSDGFGGEYNSSGITSVTARSAPAAAGCDTGGGGGDSWREVQPRMVLGVFVSSGVAGALESLGSGLASCLAYATVFMAHGNRSAGPPSSRWAMRLLQRTWGAVRLAIAACLTFAVALAAAMSAHFASPEELERLRATGWLPPGQHPPNAEGEEDGEAQGSSSEWEEVGEEEVDELMVQALDGGGGQVGHAAAAGAGAAAQAIAGVVGAVQAAAAAAAWAAAGGAPQPGAAVGEPAGGPGPAAAPAGAGPMALLGLPQLNGPLNADFVDQGIQELLNPEGEDTATDATDANGGMTGIPAHVQVVAGLNSVASWGFVAGAAPVGVLGVWIWARQLKWAVLGLVGVAQYLLGGK